MQALLCWPQLAALSITAYDEWLFHMFRLQPLAMGTLCLHIAQCKHMHACQLLYTILGCILLVTIMVATVTHLEFER